jgi:hypothetical protein
MDSNFRFRASGDTPHRFGTWFLSGKFSDDWSMDHLREVTDLVEADAINAFPVIKGLAELAPRMPEPSVEGLDRLLFGARQLLDESSRIPFGEGVLLQGKILVNRRNPRVAEQHGPCGVGVQNNAIDAIVAAAQQILIESAQPVRVGAGTAGIDQPAIRVVIGEQQRPEPVHRMRRLSKVSA